MATDNKNEKYAYLNRLSTEQLDELLRADIESLEKGDDDVVFHILEVIEERENGHPTGHLHDEDEAWEEFQRYYNIPEGEGLSLYPTEDMENEPPVEQAQRTKIIRLRPMLKATGLAAAVVICIFVVMIAAQARGIDVFGAIGRWTQETFHFVTSSSGAVQNDMPLTGTPEDNATYAAFQTALDNCGIQEELAPTRYLEGFEASEPEILSDDIGDSIYCFFSNGEDKFFSIQVRQYKSSSDMDELDFQKDDSTIKTYTGNEKTFYILSNLDNMTATWADGKTLVMSISGSISENDVKTIIDSIGG